MPVLFVQTGMVEQKGVLHSVMMEGGLTQTGEVYEPTLFRSFFLSLHTQEFVLDGKLHVHFTAYVIAEHVLFRK